MKTTYRELFIEAMENAWLCNPERNDDWSIDVEWTINSYSFEAWCYCWRWWGRLSLKSILEAIENNWLDEIEWLDY